MKQILYLGFLILISLNTVRGTEAYPDSTDSCRIKHQEMVDNVLTYAKNYLGTPYKYGGKNARGFDCSGFMHYIFEPYGLNLPYSSRSYTSVGEEIDVTHARKGDFALFKGRNASSTSIGHVALVADVDENGSIYIIHATIHKGVTIDDMTTQDYYRKRYVSMRRITPPCGPDPVGMTELSDEDVTVQPE